MNTSLTDRDERLIEWLTAVRLADIEAVRVMLGALSEVGGDVSLRRTQQRVAKLVEAGVLRRARPRLRGGSVVWVAPSVSSRREPNVFAATARHDMGIAAVSADLIRQGYSFVLDERVGQDGGPLKGAHVADGVAIATTGSRQLVEVELSPKTNVGRYQRIMRSHQQRIGEGEVSGVLYFCSPTAEPAVRAAISSYLSPPLQSYIQVWQAFTSEHEYRATVKARRARREPQRAGVAP